MIENGIFYCPIVLIIILEGTMNLLDLAQKYGTYRKHSTAKGGEYVGPCPVRSTCAGSGEDRFHIWPEQDDTGTWWCRRCDKGGDAIQFLIEVEGMTFPEACKAVGREIPEHQEMRTPQARRPAASSWQPKDPDAPAGAWLEHAEKFVTWAHNQLLHLGDGPGTPLHYLAGRGISRDSAITHRLGWNPGEKGGDLYRAREAWGLETVMKGDKKKKLWLPIGLVIPFYKSPPNPPLAKGGDELARRGDLMTKGGDELAIRGDLCRVRIRIPKERRTPEFSTPYFIVPGSAMDTFVVGGDAKGYVIIEAELDAILVAQECAGLRIGAMAMGNSTAKPTAAAYVMLAASLHISNALDYDLREGSTENAGGSAWLWWKNQFPQAERWPVPVGKDPGDAFQAGVNIRQWVMAGLPPIFSIPAGTIPAVCETKPAETETTATETEKKPVTVQYIQGKSRGGLIYFITDSAKNRAKLAEKFPGKAIFTHAEILLLKGMAPEEAEKFIVIKETFGPDAEISATGPANEENP